MDAVTLLLLLPLYTESCTPKVEALTSAAVSVAPHRLVELPQVSTASDVPKYGSAGRARLVGADRDAGLHELDHRHLEVAADRRLPLDADDDAEDLRARRDT